MSDNNGWPGKPGVPMNPEKSWWHWVGGVPCWWQVWDDDNTPQWQAAYLYYNPEEWADRKYGGPCLTPAEVDARVKEARRDALEKAAQRLEELHKNHKYNPKTGEGSEHDTGYYRAIAEGAAWILALADMPANVVPLRRARHIPIHHGGAA